MPSLTTYLDSTEGAARVMAHARLLLRLSRRFASVAPPGLAGAARVANYKSGMVVIHAENGAVAAKIRQLGRRLCSDLSLEGAQCNGIEVKVQPAEKREQSTTSTLKPLSARTFGTLEETAGALPPGGLQAALKELLARSARQE